MQKKNQQQSNFLLNEYRSHCESSGIFLPEHLSVPKARQVCPRLDAGYQILENSDSASNEYRSDLPYRPVFITFAQMNNFQKYSRLMALLAGGFFGFIILLALVIFLLRLFSITMFHIPGFDLFFQYIIIIIPYILFFAAYFYLYNKIKLSKSKSSRISARILVLTGCLICLFTLSLSTAMFLHVKGKPLTILDDNSQFALIVQVVIIFITAGVIASGDNKEKDWMERKSQGSNL